MTNENEAFVLVLFKLMCDILKVPEELLTEVCSTAWEAVTRTIPKNKKCNKVVRRFSKESLQRAKKKEK